MTKKLVVVESPAKIKTISKILGQDFHVMSCIGHFRELSKKEGTSNLGIDLEDNCKLFFDIQKEVLLNWHYSDPVDELEYNRTLAIALYQENHPNPFIQDSTLARRAWFSD